LRAKEKFRSDSEFILGAAQTGCTHGGSRLTRSAVVIQGVEIAFPAAFQPELGPSSHSPATKCRLPTWHSIRPLRQKRGRASLHRRQMPMPSPH
jgi:hypothetical protein